MRQRCSDIYRIIRNRIALCHPTNSRRTRELESILRSSIVGLILLSAAYTFAYQNYRRVRIIVETRGNKRGDCTDNGVHENYEPIVSPRSRRRRRIYRILYWTWSFLSPFLSRLIATDRTGSDSTLYIVITCLLSDTLPIGLTKRDR